jgi:hypothetical protein
VFALWSGRLRRDGYLSEAPATAAAPSMPVGGSDRSGLTGRIIFVEVGAATEGASVHSLRMSDGAVSSLLEIADEIMPLTDDTAPSTVEDARWSLSPDGTLLAYANTFAKPADGNPLRVWLWRLEPGAPLGGVADLRPDASLLEGLLWLPGSLSFATATGRIGIVPGTAILGTKGWDLATVAVDPQPAPPAPAPPLFDLETTRERDAWGNVGWHKSWSRDTSSREEVDQMIQLVAFREDLQRAVVALRVAATGKGAGFRIMDLGDPAGDLTLPLTMQPVSAGSPDGRWVAFATCEGCEDGAPPTLRLLDVASVAPASGDAAIQPAATLAPGEQLDGIRWSADSRWLAWTGVVAGTPHIGAARLVADLGQPARWQTVPLPLAEGDVAVAFQPDAPALIGGSGRVYDLSSGSARDSGITLPDGLTWQDLGRIVPAWWVPDDRPTDEPAAEAPSQGTPSPPIQWYSYAPLVLKDDMPGDPSVTTPEPEPTRTPPEDCPIPVMMCTPAIPSDPTLTPTTCPPGQHCCPVCRQR